MIESMLNLMLGPMRHITDIYMEHLLVSNSAVILSYFTFTIFKRKRMVDNKS
ncbi:hypothetical protein [Staphylococcus intermedius]|uniref:Uncharacterized protein n=1 Tax=Staphylococcus intermedius NCTC 11048 TaxID=1141106 RepID=A0A380G6R4_STAIN|nr:hypothetical protein [Staphylococcus intermedius]SUM45671.1 Uncharacterised protein [Staphylococcus intermedius NCTC 11048]